MPGKHNAGGCGCCDATNDCWGCNTPTGVSISGAGGTFPLIYSCDCTYVDGTYNSDGTSLDHPSCQETWNAEDLCCYESGGTYFIAKTNYTVNVALSSGKAVTIDISQSTVAGTIGDTGSGTGDPCTKPWTFACGTQIIDGWQFTRSAGCLVYQSAVRHYKSFTTCPTTDQVIPKFSDISTGACDLTGLTVTLLMT